MSDPEVSDIMELLAVPGESGKEAAVARLLTDKLIAMGVLPNAITHDEANRKSEIGGEVGNMIVRIDGHGRGERRMLSSHMDTIPGAVGCRPRLEGDKIINDAAGHCLGGDARAGCALLLAAVRALLKLKGDHPPWTIVFFIQEEIGLVGSRWLDVTPLGTPVPSMAFNFDSEEASDLIHVVIGTERLHITINGVACHTMAPRHGVSAAEIFCRAAAKMMESGWHGRIEKTQGTGLANVGVLRGGAGSNVVMPELYVLFEARSHDKSFRDQIIENWKAALRQCVDQCNAASPNARHQATVSFRQGPIYNPYSLPRDAPVVRAAADAIHRLELEPNFCIDNGGNDSAWIVAHGIPCVCLGFGSRQIHTVDEWVDVPEFKRCCRLVEQIVTAPLKTEARAS